MLGSEQEKKAFLDQLLSHSPEEVLGMLLLDLRNPTNAIMNCAGIMREEESQQQRDKLLDEISNQGRFIYDYLNTVLDCMKRRRGGIRTSEASDG